MRKLLFLGILGTAFLAGCGQSYQEKTSMYRTVMLNGEVISSDTNEYGVTDSLVKYNGKLYSCQAAISRVCREI